MQFCLYSPFTFAEALQGTDISPVPSLDLQPNTCGGTAKKITSSPYRKFVGATQKRKSNRSLNPKPISLHEMLFLVLQKDGREGFAGIQIHLTLYQILILTKLFLSMTIQWKNKMLIVCTVQVVSLKTTKGRMDTMCKIFQMGICTLCWYGGRFYL